MPATHVRSAAAASASGNSDGMTDFSGTNSNTAGPKPSTASNFADTSTIIRPPVIHVGPSAFAAAVIPDGFINFPLAPHYLYPVPHYPLHFLGGSCFAGQSMPNHWVPVSSFAPVSVSDRNVAGTSPPMEVDEENGSTNNVATSRGACNRSYLDRVSCLNFHLNTEHEKDNVKVQGRSGTVTWKNALKYTKCQNQHITEMRLFFDGKKAVAVLDSPESQQEVADALVTFAYFDKHYRNFKEAFELKRRSRLRNMTSFLNQKFHCAPLKFWLNDEVFKSVLDTTFSNPVEAKERYEERQRLQREFFAPASSNMVSHLLVFCCLGGQCCLDLL